MIVIFETRDGDRVATSFVGDNGLTWMLSEEEAQRLFDLDDNEKIHNGTQSTTTAKDLIGSVVIGPVATEEEIERRFGPGGLVEDQYETYIEKREESPDDPSE